MCLSGAHRLNCLHRGKWSNSNTDSGNLADIIAFGCCFSISDCLGQRISLSNSLGYCISICQPYAFTNFTSSWNDHRSGDSLL